MYKTPFYITEPIGNNSFSFEKRKNKKLYVPSLIEIEDLEKIELQSNPSSILHELENKIAFEDFGFDDKLSTNYGLKNFYKIKWKGKDIYLFDNHNHAFYFWYLARSEGIIGDNNTLIHIDEYADTRDNDKHLLKPDSLDLFKVYEFTNRVLNVGDYIKPAIEEGIIGDVVQIRNESNLLDYYNTHSPFDGNSKKADGRIILNLDLDFFQPDLDYIDYELKKKVILDSAKKSSVITVSTSPFFINQELAVNVFKDIFGQ